MISDVLSDAVQQIRDYERTYEDYRKIRAEIEIVVSYMDALRFALDLSPGDPWTHPRFDAMLAAIRRAAGAAGELRALQCQFINEATQERAIRSFDDQPPSGRPS
jgi:hypothetical protein